MTVKVHDIVYVRARVCSEDLFTIAGKSCVMIEPVTKSGRSIESGWPIMFPQEWLITIDEMKKAARA